AGRTERYPDVNPLLATGNGPLALGRVHRILAVTGVDGDIDHSRASFLHRGAKLLEIFRIRPRKDRAPGLDLVNAEFLGDVSREVFQFDLLRCWHRAGSLAVPPLPSHDELAKGIRRHGHPVPRGGRE